MYLAHWSIAKTKNRETEASGLGWDLFLNYKIARDKYQPDYFLYENNKSMSPAIRAQITNELGVEPVLINSALVSAQSRQRLYWVGKRNQDGTYIQVDVELPNDMGILLIDILETTTQEKCSVFKVTGTPLTEREMEYMLREVKGGKNHFDFCYYHDASNDKSSCITANTYRGVPYNVVVQPVRAEAVPALNKPVYWVKDGQITIKGKQYHIRLRDGCYIIRKLTVPECMRLQTVPEWYVFPVSDTQAYKMLGNGWTVDVAVHILRHIPGINTEPVEVLSMYDGMSCGHIALDKLGATVYRYYATEIDKYAIQTTQANYPETVQLGDAFQVREDGWRIIESDWRTNNENRPD